MSTWGIENWVIGVTLSTLGCTMSNMGVNLQKLTHNRLQQEALVTGNLRSAYLNPLWVIGLLCVIVGSVFDLVAFGFADMSLLAPLGAMTLVINLLIAPCFLGEKLTLRDIISTTIILGGTVLSLAFGSKSENTYSYDELINMFFETVFLCYAGIATIILLSIFAWLYYLKTLRKNGDPVSERMERVERMLFPFLAGFCGGHSVLFAKSAAEVVKMTFIKHENQFVYMGTYFLLIGLGAFLFMQMRFLNEALERCDALLVVPVYQVCWVIMNTIIGMSYFQDYKTMDTLSINMFTLGVLITVIGVYILAQRDNRASQYKDDELTDEHVNLPKDVDGRSSTADLYRNAQGGQVHSPILKDNDVLTLPSGASIHEHEYKGSLPRLPHAASGLKIKSLSNTYNESENEKQYHANMKDHNIDLHLAEIVEKDLRSKHTLPNSTDAVDNRVSGLEDDDTVDLLDYHHYPSLANTREHHLGIDPVEAATISPLALFGASAVISAVTSAVTGRRSRSSSFVSYDRRSSFNDLEAYHLPARSHANSTDNLAKRVSFNNNTSKSSSLEPLSNVADVLTTQSKPTEPTKIEKSPNTLNPDLVSTSPDVKPSFDANVDLYQGDMQNETVTTISDTPTSTKAGINVSLGDVDEVVPNQSINITPVNNDNDVVIAISKLNEIEAENDEMGPNQKTSQNTNKKGRKNRR